MTSLSSPNLDLSDSDIDECDGPLNQCAFRCANLPGTYTCVCPMGYKVADDGIHCEGTCGVDKACQLVWPRDVLMFNKTFM